ncbi:MAG: phospho-sugar mutase [Microbacterium sp.]
MADALRAASAWRDQDPDAGTRAELDELIRRSGDDDAAAAEIVSRFSGRLQFGTAGLRGALGAGPLRMNRVLVAQAAAGLAAHLREALPDRTPSVVIGYDARPLSDVFAHESAEVVAGAGLRVTLLPRTAPTPLLAFAVRHLDADAGVMVTASHNPRGDNGYKVYLGGAHEGAQIVPPIDQAIASRIARAAEDPIDALPRSAAYEVAGEEVADAYAAATASVAPAPDGARGMVWAYTAMHGVGWETFARVLERAGYPLPVLAEAQISPDGTFPTTPFPNPEEPGAMDLVFAAAADAGAELALAHDPDADRLAVGVPGPDGVWRRLTGNEVGLVLGLRAARRATGGTLACSLVSSPGLAEIAARHGLDSVETLTGFKWISRAPDLVYGYEEALGYLVDPETVRDKDGISAAVAVLELAAEARASGRTVADLVDEVASEIGVFRDGQIAIRVDDTREIARAMAALRAEPPSAFGAVAVAEVDDLLVARGDEPTGDILRFRLADGSRVIFRPSGTEPKLKAYLDVRGDSAADAAARLSALEAAVRAALSPLA